MENEHERPGFWAVLPAAVRYDQDLPSTAKLLYAEISALTDQRGYCFAKNEYFQDLYSLSDRTIRRLLSDLEKRGYIVIKDGNGGEGRRKIFAGINPLTDNPDKNVREPGQKCPGNPDKNVRVILNNKKENKKEEHPPATPQGGRRASCSPTWKPERFEKFWIYYPRMSDGSKPAKARAVKAWDKLRPDDTTIDQMATALRRQKQSEQWQRGIGIPYASSWLNGRRWEDDYEEPEDEAEEEEDGDVEWL